MPLFSALKTEIGQVAIAHGDAAAGDQQAVDERHQAAEQGAGGHEADRCSLGHKRPLFLVADPFRFMTWGHVMYTRCHKQSACLHSSNFCFASQQAAEMALQAGYSR